MQTSEKIAEAKRLLEEVAAAARAVEDSGGPEPCPTCGRQKSHRDYAYPRGWEPPPGVEMPESEVPPCCGSWIERGSDEDKAWRQIECLAYAAGKQVARPAEPERQLCRYCGRPESMGGTVDEGECGRRCPYGNVDERTGALDKRARELECAQHAAKRAA